VRPDALIPTCTRKESKKSNLRFNASQLKDSVSLNDRSGKVPFTKASLLYAPSAAVNVPGGLAASPLATPAPTGCVMPCSAEPEVNGTIRRA